jgi:hypothetical protein
MTAPIGTPVNGHVSDLVPPKSQKQNWSVSAADLGGLADANVQRIVMQKSSQSKSWRQHYSG